MGNFNLTITNEGAALLADVIANQGSLEFTEVRFSSTNYVGSEAALTEGTFGGTFITAVPSASILNQTTIDIAASFDNTTFTVAKQLYSIGVIAEDGDGNTALVAVCTTSVPDTIPAYMAPGSNYAFNINMTVSSTDHITVTGSVASVLYVSDIVDSLNSYETNKPLSANQGRLLKELIPSSGMFPHVIVISETGSVVTLTKGAKVITATETSTGHFEADVDEYGTWTIDSVLAGDDAQTTIYVDAVKIYTIDDSHFQASITVKYNTNGTCALAATGQTTQYATSSPYTFTVHAATPYTVTVNYGGTTITRTVVITTSGQTETVDLFWGKTFASATDDEIANMVSLADAGEIDLETDCGWIVGQEHQVSLSAIAASGTYDGVSWSVGESQSAQTITLVLMHRGLYELVNPVLDKQGQTRNTCSFVVGIKDCLEAKGYMNSTNTNIGSWNGCARRNWCNGGFREAIPGTLRSVFKQFKTITAETYNGSTNQTSYDYFAFVAEKEVFGAASYSNPTEAAALTQFTYYETSANRIKKWDGNDNVWRGRSPYSGASTDFCYINHLGSADHGNSTYNVAMSPFGCL